jgi:reactive intermediate/imine deaminase
MRQRMKPEVIRTDRAPKAIGPYSQAVRVGETIYVSGQLPIDPSTGVLAPGGIESAGGSIRSIVRVTFFLAHWDDFPAMNEVCAELFHEPYPARSTIQNSRPMAALVGADAIAIRMAMSSDAGATREARTGRLLQRVETDI